MAQANYTYQQTRNVSINKNSLQDIAANDNLTQTDIRVCLVLFTELNGWVTDGSSKNKKDPLNYKIVDKDSIARTLGIKKKKVKEAMENLMNEGYIEKGDSETVSNGYRFTF